MPHKSNRSGQIMLIITRIKRLKALCVDCVRGQKDESVQHIVNACGTLAQKEYKRRHDNVAKKVHWDTCSRKGCGQ